MQAMTKFENETTQFSISAFTLGELKFNGTLICRKACLLDHGWKTIILKGSKLILIENTLPNNHSRIIVHSIDMTNHKYFKPQIPDVLIMRNCDEFFEYYLREELCDFEITRIEGLVRPPLFHRLAGSDQSLVRR